MPAEGTKKMQKGHPAAAEVAFFDAFDAHVHHNGTEHCALRNFR
jgi:hypothetical protein